MSGTVIEVTPDTYRELERAYRDAVLNKQDEFTFKGEVLLTAYAKYLLEYMLNTLMKERAR